MFVIHLYRLVTTTYFLSIRIASWFSIKARRWVKGRRNWRQQFDQFEPRGKVVWIHCASLGEYEQARPLIEALQDTAPSFNVVLSFFSPTGYDNYSRVPNLKKVLYLPPDTPQNARDFIQRLKPDLAIFVKYEFWYYVLHATAEARVPLILISAHFRPAQFKGIRRLFFGRVLQLFDHIFVQDPASVQLLKERINYQAVTCVGDTRADRVWNLAQQATELPAALESLRATQNLIVCGSTWPADEYFLAQVRRLFHKNYPSLVLTWLIVPHEPGPNAEDRLKKLFREDLYKLDLATEAVPCESGKVYLLNQMGWLSRVYTLADVCWIGGGFGTGIHNVLEAAVFGKGVCFGPNYRKFNEAVELVNRGLAWSCRRADEAVERFGTLLTDDRLRQRVANEASDFVKQRRGAVEEILRWFKKANILETDYLKINHES